MFKKQFIFLALLGGALSGCGSDNNSATTGGTTSGGTSTGGTTGGSTTGQTYSNQTVVPGKISDTLPQALSLAKDAGFNMYIPVSINTASQQSVRTNSSNDTIHIIAYFDETLYSTDKERDAAREIVKQKTQRAANIMQHFLTNLPESTYGVDKSSIAELMASRHATLMLTANDDANEEMLTKLFITEAYRQGQLQQWVIDANQPNSHELDTSTVARFLQSSEAFDNTYPDQFEAVIEEILVGVQTSANSQDWLVHSQSLMFRELTVEGDCHYMSNFANYCEDLGKHADRDAGFEEILHLVQAQGIAPNPKFKTFQDQFQQRALDLYNRHAAGQDSVWQPTQSSWNDWLSDDIDPEIGPSYSHEYLAAAFEAYMGMWEHTSSGLDSYQALTRSDMRNDDFEAAFWIENMFHDYLQYTAHIDSAGVETYYNNRFPQGGLTPTFHMSKSTHPPMEPYTFKSRWLVNAKIIGDVAMNLTANDQDNTIEGNSQNNVVDGKDGVDTYIVSEDFSNCTIFHQKYSDSVNCPSTGIDELMNFEKIKFNDQVISLTK
ncbi:hypothetical protein KP803_14235 [Vibrio sp. ZSDE26]|uniref:Lipoprotein n=1 Tax=Vibrio amylolyticus TaxID=2847292 RepID=A0A9X1XKK8_9VIBR|nr:hypothetical protein [Vibrio amylolyticus]MCK6264436.1 hypothetical protein [Vibrio amylolyticus]